VLERTTRDLDYFAGPDDAAAVRRLAEAFERAALRQGLVVQQERSEPSFVRLSVSDGREQSEVDLAMDYRALEPVDTRYGPALDLRELGANKVLAIFARAEPRDFLDLERLTQRFAVEDLIALAAQKDPSLDLEVLNQFMDRARMLPRADFDIPEPAYQRLLTAVTTWQTAIRQLHERRLGHGHSRTDPGWGHGVDDDRVQPQPVHIGPRYR
jgi:hypothetical protein